MMQAVRAVERALDILCCFSVEEPTLSVHDLAKRVGLSRPTLYRLLNTLELAGLVQSEGEPARFRLGPTVASIAHVWFSTTDVQQVASGIIDRVHKEIGDTVSLFKWQGDKRLCVAELSSPNGLRFVRGIGYTEVLTKGASGKVILAYLGESSLKDILPNVGGVKLQRQLRKELLQIRERGYAVSHGEIFVGALSIAAPFFDRTNRIAGALGVSGADAGYSEHRIKQTALLLKQAAKEISLGLGGENALKQMQRA